MQTRVGWLGERVSVTPEEPRGSFVLVSVDNTLRDGRILVGLHPRLN